MPSGQANDVDEDIKIEAPKVISRSRFDEAAVSGGGGSLVYELLSKILTGQKDADWAYENLLRLCVEEQEESDEKDGSTLQAQAREQSTLIETTTDLLKKLNLPSSLEGSKDTNSGGRSRSVQKEVKI